MIFVGSIRGSRNPGGKTIDLGSSVSHLPQPRFGYFRKDPGT